MRFYTWRKYIIKTYLTPNEKWHQLRGILIGISIGLFIALGIVKIALL